jgi:hypothetical protein
MATITDDQMRALMPTTKIYSSAGGRGRSGCGSTEAEPVVTEPGERLRLSQRR